MMPPREEVTYGDPAMVAWELYDRLVTAEKRISVAIDSLLIGDKFSVTRSLRLHTVELDTMLGLLVQLQEEELREFEGKRGAV